MLIQHKILRKIAQEIFVHTGASEPDAGLVANQLVDANLMGHDSHGIGLLPIYSIC